MNTPYILPEILILALVIIIIPDSAFGSIASHDAKSETNKKAVSLNRDKLWKTSLLLWWEIVVIVILLNWLLLTLLHTVPSDTHQLITKVVAYVLMSSLTLRYYIFWNVLRKHSFPIRLFTFLTMAYAVYFLKFASEVHRPYYLSQILVSLFIAETTILSIHGLLYRVASNLLKY